MQASMEINDGVSGERVGVGHPHCLKLCYVAVQFPNTHGTCTGIFENGIFVIIITSFSPVYYIVFMYSQLGLQARLQIIIIRCVWDLLLGIPWIANRQWPVAVDVALQEHPV